MSKIKDMYKQLEYQQNLLLKTKLQTAIEALESGREIGEEEKEDYIFSFDELSKLAKLMRQQGLEDKKDFILLTDRVTPYDESETQYVILKVDNNLLEIVSSYWSGKWETKFVSQEELLEEVYDTCCSKYYSKEEIKEMFENFQNFELDNLKIEEPKETEKQDVKAEGKQTKDRYANIIIEKLRIIEETDNIEEIPSPLFTLDETKRIREVLKGKEDCFKNICRDEDVIQYDGWVTGRETYTTNIFEIGNKVVELGDFDGTSWSFVKTHEQYLEYLKDYQRELTDLPQRKITIEEIQEAFVEYNSKIENARKDFEQFIKDSVPKEDGQIRPWVICKDGREYSIQASKAHYCSPKEHGLEDYDEFEVKYKENTEEPELEKYKGEEPVCCFVPKDVIVKVISEHGGLDKELMQQRLEEQKKIYEQEDEEYEKWIKEESNGDPLVEQFLRNAKFQQVLRYVKRKKDLIKKNEQAKDLLNEYEKQGVKDGQEQGDEE